MGFKATWGSEDDSYASYTDREEEEATLALFKRLAMAEVVGTTDLPSDVPCQDHFALIVRVENVDAMCEELKENGVELIDGPENHPDWGIRSAYFRDPDRNLIEIYSDLSRMEWSEGLKEASRRSEVD
jgi:catechol 2,3-dioxygenase-like lactoylglutathione lyase family enzyme